MQQHNAPKHSQQSATEWLANKIIMFLPLPCSSLDLNLIEKLWQDLKRAVRKGVPSNLDELKQWCKEELA